MSSSAARAAGSAILRSWSMGNGGPWQTLDPFLFCVHHNDKYPAGTATMGVPAHLLAERNIGSDFSSKDGFSMYHGEESIPGFPGHPHRGFETVTLVRQGRIDHTDSTGASARFGGGDAQWVTAGAGVVHSEMFPLLHEDKPNPLELFQIWLNLPAHSKMVKPHFTMLWSEQIPRRTFIDAVGKKTEVTVVAGELDGMRPPPPPPESWASDADNDLAIWSLALDSGAKWTLPAARSSKTTRVLHQFLGTGVKVDGKDMKGPVAVQLRPDSAVELEATQGAVELLLLQARPISEPVAQRGPFVMNTEAELQQAFRDYRATQFGGWPFDSHAPVHPREQRRFAKHGDGRIEQPEKKQ